MKNVSIEQGIGQGAINIEINDPILPKLQRALSPVGDYPIRTSVINNIKQTLNQPNIDLSLISNIILSEPALACRIIHLVNSAYCQSNNPIQTISQAVIEIGTRNIVELCQGLVQTEKFLAKNKKQVFLTEYLKRNLLSSIICKNLVSFSENSKHISEEEAYLASSYYSIGQLLLAYYFPQIFTSAKERSEQRGGSIEQNICQIIGMDFLHLNIEILEALKIPNFYKAILIETSDENNYNSFLSDSIKESYNISKSLIEAEPNFSLSQSSLKFERSYSYLNNSQIKECLVKSISDYQEYLEISNIPSLGLPPCLSDLSESNDSENKEKLSSLENNKSKITPEFNKHIEEIILAGKLNEPISSILATAMESLHFGLDFERVILLLKDEEQEALLGRMSLGDTRNLNTKAIRRNLNDSKIQNSIDIIAYNEKSLITEGFPLLKNASSYLAMPVGTKNQILGVIYADKISSKPQELSTQNRISVTLLIEMIDNYLETNN